MLISRVMVREVELGLRTADEALAAVQSADVLEKVTLYVGLLNEIPLDEDQRQRLRDQVVEAVVTFIIRNEPAYATHQDRDTLTALLKLSAPYLSGQQAIDAFLKLQDVWHLDAAIEAIAPHLDDAAWESLLEIGLSLEDKFLDKTQSTLLKAIAPYIPETLAGRLLRAADGLASLDSWNDPRRRIRAILSKYLPEQKRELILRDALEGCLNDQEGEMKLYNHPALEEIIPLLSPELLDLVLQRARKIQSTWGRYGALMMVTRVLTGEEQRAVLQEALALVPDIQAPHSDSIDDEFRSSAICRLAPLLPDDLISSAFELAMKIRSNRERADAFTALAQRFEGEAQQAIFENALDAALHPRVSNVTYESGSLQALLELAPLLWGDALERALDFLLMPIEKTALAIEMEDIFGDDRKIVTGVLNNHDRWREKVLDALAERLSPEQVARVLAIRRAE